MAKKKRRKPVIGNLDLKRENYIIFLIGVVMLILGYVLMAMGGTTSPLSITIAPVILVVAFLVVIPFAIMYRKGSPEEEQR